MPSRDRLTARLEVRWDDADLDSEGITSTLADKSDDIFGSDSSSNPCASFSCATESTQLLVGADVTYEF